jgi:HEPN domain-containing protein
MPDDLIQKETARWLRYAKEDYNSALIVRQSGVSRNACLLAQQSAEKAIKSIYAFTNQKIAKTHDLDLLKNQVPDGWSTKSRFADLSELSFWAVESRYPGDLPEATEADADAAIALAESVLHSVEDDLHRHGFAG